MIRIDRQKTYELDDGAQHRINRDAHRLVVVFNWPLIPTVVLHQVFDETALIAAGLAIYET